MTTLSTTAPYLGPRPFLDDESDRARFFARDRDTREIVSLILGHPLVMVYAQSGAGKTSIFNANVLPRLRDSGFSAMPLTRVAGGISGGPTSNAYVLNALAGLVPAAHPSDLAGLTLADFFAERVDSAMPTVVVFDQFEEIFTHDTPAGEAGRREFFEQVAEALGAHPDLRVAFVLREEYIARLDPFAAMLPERLRIRYRLERLRFDAALRAVTAPLESTDRSYGDGVAERLVDELSTTRTITLSGEAADISGGYVEPVQLQVVCLNLWNNLPDDARVITQDHLDQHGDVSEALGLFYEQVVATTVESGHDERSVRAFFGPPVITTMGTRGTVQQGDQTTGGLPNSAVAELEANHLIRAEYRSGVRWYELTHDRLVDPILARNAAWMADLEATNPLAVPALTWDALGQDDGSLLRGQQLDNAEAYAAAPPVPLTELEDRFLAASLAH